MCVLLCRDRPAQLCNREKWYCVSTTEPSFCSHCLRFSSTRAHLISTTIKPPTMVPSVDMVSRRTRGKLRIEGMNSFDCKVINSVLLQFWNCIYAGGRTLYLQYYILIFFFFFTTVKTTLNYISLCLMLIIHYHLQCSLFIINKCINTNSNSFSHVKYTQTNNQSINIWLRHIHHS